MKRKDVEKTTWAKEWMVDVSDEECYQEAMRFASREPCELMLQRSDLVPGVKWALVVPDSGGFWLDAFLTKRECTDLCKKMGWKIVP